MNHLKPQLFSDVFDVQGWDQRLETIKRAGQADFASGRIVSRRMTGEFALRFAELHEQSSRNFDPLAAFKKLKTVFTNPLVVEALNTVIFLIENGKAYDDALSYRPAVFSRELVAAFKAAEKDCDYSKHLLDFVKYRQLLGEMHRLFDNRDYQGLRKTLL